MTYSQIYRLSRTVGRRPNRAIAGPADDDPNHADVGDENVVRFVLDYAEPAFGWLSALGLAMSGRGFPIWPEGPVSHVYRAWLYCKRPNYFKGNEDIRPVAMACAIHCKAKERPTRKAIEAMLLAPDASLAKVAETTGRDIRVIEAYAALFWDVLDRRADATYLRNIVYPDTRYEELLESYFNKGNFDLMMARTAYNRDTDVCAWVGGYRNNPVAGLNASQASESLQREFMTQALMLATSGLLMTGQAHATILGAKGIIQAGKIGGTDTGGANQPAGVLSAALARAVGQNGAAFKATFREKAKVLELENDLD